MLHVRMAFLAAQCSDDTLHSKETAVAVADLDPPPRPRDASSNRDLPVALIRACGLKPGEPVIAVGCVEVALIAALRELGHEDVTVLDRSLETLERLRVALADLEREVLLIETDVLTFRPRRRYGLWYDAGFLPGLQHGDDRQCYVQVAQFALRPEGHLIMAQEIVGNGHGEVMACRTTRERAADLGPQFELIQELTTDIRSAGRRQLCCRFQRHAPSYREAAAD
jgi:hypothetical protein